MLLKWIFLLLSVNFDFIGLVVISNLEMGKLEFAHYYFRRGSSLFFFPNTLGLHATSNVWAM